MTVVSPSLRVGAPSIVDLHSRGNKSSDFQKSDVCAGNLPVCVPARASLQFQQLDQRKLPTLRAVGIYSQRLDRKRITLGSKSRKSVFACNAALNATCSQGQTQTLTREAPTITKAPVRGKEKSPRLDDGGNGFPPRDDRGGGGGGGGGGENFSGGFFLFGFLLFLGFLKDIESEQDHQGSRGR